MIQRVTNVERFYRSCLPVLTVVFFVIGSFPKQVFAHEPVFSIGPETIFEGGWGIETEFEFDDAGDGKTSTLHYEILYGLTKDLSLTLEIPQVLRSREGHMTEDGLGDIMLRGKYQLFRRDTLGAQDKISAILGIKFPTGDEDAKPRLGTGTTDFLFGLSAGHESRTWYRFATLRYFLRTKHDGFGPGDKIFYDVTIGYRPWRREYLQWDLVGLLEMSGEYEFGSELGGKTVRNSGGNTIWLGPSLLFSYRNIMVKGGIQMPVYQQLKGNQEHNDFRTVFAIEYHF
ncbi:MAG: transporter [Planctomycetes bacterium]|nr:transporter [Planctomycetota bacterium]